MFLFAWQTLSQRRGRRLSPARVAEVQHKRLRRLVGEAVRGSAFYREKFRGIDLERFRLAELPVTTKAELMADFDRAVTDPRVTRAGLEAFMDEPANAGRLFLGRYVASHTSGSQGQSLLIVQDRALLDLSFALQMSRGNNGPVSLAEVVRGFLRPVRLAVVSLKAGFYPSAAQFLHMPAAARRLVEVLSLSQTAPDVVERLNAFRPRILTAYAGVLERLALEVQAGRLRLAPELRQVVNNSESLTERARARVEAAFGLSVMDNYATGECPFLSNGCPTGPGAHVNADWAILEVVDDDNRPVPAGTPGRKVLLTNLANFAQPFIRYEVGDVVTMADAPCRCGSRLPRVARVEGRAADAFAVGAGPRRRQLLQIVFVNAFEYMLDIREWQVVQQEGDRVLVRFEPLPGATPDLDRARRALEREMRDYQIEGARVDFEVVPRLDPDPRTGKFRRVVTLAGRSASLAAQGREAVVGSGRA